VVGTTFEQKREWGKRKNLAMGNLPPTKKLGMAHEKTKPFGERGGVDEKRRESLERWREMGCLGGFDPFGPKVHRSTIISS